MHEYLFQIRFGYGDIRKRQLGQGTKQNVKISAVEEAYGIPVCLYVFDLCKLWQDADTA